MKKLAVLLLALTAPFTALNAKPDNPLLLNAGSQDFLRLHEVDGRAAALQVAVVSFVSRQGNAAEPPVMVDLVSAVHVGDLAYYQELNRRFADYDVVLYELVAPEGTKIPAGGPDRSKPRSFASQMQGGMSSTLKLSRQLEQVDYTPDNFVHADLTPEQFSQSMDERGESFFKLLLKAWVTAFTQPMKATAVSDTELLKVLFSSDRSRQMKIMMARQFHDMDNMMEMLDGGEAGSTLISVRNQRALEVLSEQLDQGHRRVAIFYGAAHMMDFAQRLTADFQLVPQSRQWLQAWDLKKQQN